MPFDTKPIINGTAYDFSSIDLTVVTSQGPKTAKAFSTLNYQQGLSPGMLRGNGPTVLAYTRGTYEASGSFTMYREAYDDLLVDLKKCTVPSPKVGYMQKIFSMVAMYGPEGRAPSVDDLKFCRITSDSSNNQQGGDPTVIEVEFLITKLLRNGQAAVLDRNGR